MCSMNHLKNTFKEFVEDKHIPNLILSMTWLSVRLLLIKGFDEIGASLVINGSEESGIDVLRNKIKNLNLYCIT